jgi:hypothetical protein
MQSETSKLAQWQRGDVQRSLMVAETFHHAGVNDDGFTGWLQGRWNCDGSNENDKQHC